MRILFVSHNASRTGAPLALLQELDYICNHCQDMTPEVLLLEGGELEPDFRKLCRVHKLWEHDNIFKRIMRRLNIKRFVYPYLYMFHKRQFDVVYANTVASLEICCQIKKRLFVPLIVHIHEAEALMHMFSIKSEWLLSCDSLITVSTLAQRNLIENYGVPIQKIVLQRPVSIWVERYLSGAVQIDPEYSGNEMLIGCFTNGNWYKSTEIIPLLAKTFYDKYPEQRCKFVIIGEMPEIINYHLMYDIRKMCLEDKVIIYGKVENPMNILSQVDILALPSREESSSLVAQEAGVMMKPIVCFEGATGAEEWIGKGAGVIVPYLDLEKMSDALSSMLQNEDERKQYGMRAREIVTEMCKESSQMRNVVFAIKKTVLES